MSTEAPKGSGLARTYGAPSGPRLATGAARCARTASTRSASSIGRWSPTPWARSASSRSSRSSTCSRGEGAGEADETGGRPNSRMPHDRGRPGRHLRPHIARGTRAVIRSDAAPGRAIRARSTTSAQRSAVLRRALLEDRTAVPANALPGNRPMPGARLGPHRRPGSSSLDCGETEPPARAGVRFWSGPARKEVMPRGRWTRAGARHAR
jgi:hypothetical protein